MGCLEGSGVPVLYIGRAVPKGEYELKRVLSMRYSSVGFSF
jgi:hypothetical protein